MQKTYAAYLPQIQLPKKNIQKGITDELYNGQVKKLLCEFYWRHFISILYIYIVILAHLVQIVDCPMLMHTFK